jgi:hypothetical protein
MDRRAAERLHSEARFARGHAMVPGALSGKSYRTRPLLDPIGTYRIRTPRGNSLSRSPERTKEISCGTAMAGG